MGALLGGYPRGIRGVAGALALALVLGGCEPSPESRPADGEPGAQGPSGDSAEVAGGVASEGPGAGVPEDLLVRTDSSPEGLAPPPEASSVSATDRFPRPDHVRGIYLNAWTAGSSRRRAQLIELAGRTEVNSFVIDLKDASGYVSHRTQNPLADSIGATGEVRIPNIAGVLDDLEAAGIYPIARIVIVKDPLLVEGRPDLAIQDTAGGVWVDSKELVWLDPWNPAVWEYHVALAREAVELGFPEIQWDYVRFPDASESDMDRAVIQSPEGKTRADAIRGFLSYAREELSDLGVQITADVFGVTTTFRRDVGIGQLWESFIDQVDVALPMVYPSHYWEGSFGIEDPNAYPYEIVRWALEDALERSDRVEGAGLTRPWLQDFTLGKPAYGVPEVRAQIQATYDAGIQEWILWNPGSRYTVGALAPAGGWEDHSEPLIRVAGELVLLEEREAALARAWDEPAEVVPVSDSVIEGAPAVVGDSILPLDSIMGPDSLPRPDTLPRPDAVPGPGVPVGPDKLSGRR